MCEEPSLQFPAKDQDGRGLLELSREAIPQHGTLAGEIFLGTEMWRRSLLLDLSDLPRTRLWKREQN